MKISRNSLVIINLSILLVLFLCSVFVISERKSVTKVQCTVEEEKFKCWGQLLSKELEKEGLTSSFEVLANLYETEPRFVPECHGFTHELGEKAYRIFSKGIKIEMTPKVSYCGYGFYHGFVETLLHSGAKMEQAQKFCSDVDKQLSIFGNKNVMACYHGIGHGAVDGDPRSFKNPQELIGNALNICKTVSSFESEVYQCGTGVFNALALALNSNAFGLNLSNNPYDVCLNQEGIFKKSCYEQMNTRAASMSNGDFFVASKFLDKIPEKDYSISAMEQLASSLIANKVGQGSSYAVETKACRLTPTHLKVPCINGLVGGILEFGKPDYEYLEAIDFCNTLESVGLEKENCFDRLASSLRVIYPKEKASLICAKFDNEYQKFC